MQPMIARSNTIGRGRWSSRTCLVVTIVLLSGLMGCTKETAPPVLGTVPWFSLTNQQGKTFGSAHLDGKVWVATLMHTRDGTISAKQTEQFAAFQNKWVDQAWANDVQLVSITVDPVHDRPQVLREYADQAGAALDRWKFLTGDRHEILGLARFDLQLPVSDVSDNGDKSIDHSTQFILVDRVSRIRGYYDGLDADSRTDLLRDLKLVAAEPEGNPHADGAPQDAARPASIFRPPWVDERRAAQLATKAKAEVFNDFQFSDQRIGSGIRFEQHIVADAGKLFKGNHYDHGNGVAIADVDNDGYLDIYFSTQLGSNELWRNRGDGTFENITDQAGVGLADRVGVAASFADIDNDGDADLFVTSVRGGNTLFENDGNGRFADITKQAGVEYTGHSSGAVFFDYNRDGRLDMLLTNVGLYTTDEIGPGGYYIGVLDGFAGHLKPERTELSLIYRNDGGNKFTEVSTELGFQDGSWSGDASPIDVNEDGWPDIYLLDMQGHDEYWENVEGKKFVQKSREVFPETPWGSMGIKVFDFDNDGHMDIYLTDMHTDMVDNGLGIDLTGVKFEWTQEKDKMTNSYPDSLLNTDLKHIQGNALFRSLGGGKYEEISDKAGAETFWPWGLSTGDLNADGWEDAFVTGSMNYQFRYAINSLLLNNKGKEFLDSEYIVGVEPRRGRRTAKRWVEFDCDGEDKDDPFCDDKTGRTVIWGAIGTRASVIFDLDNDGDLDIVTNDFNSEPLVLISNLHEKKPTLRYLKIKLIGSKSNRDGLGAIVRVRIGQRTLTRVHDGKSGYMSQSSYPLYIGLGDADQIDSIEVVWPSGASQTRTGPIEPNQLLEINEPAS